MRQRLIIPESDSRPADLDPCVRPQQAILPPTPCLPAIHSSYTKEQEKETVSCVVHMKVYSWRA